MSQVKLEVYSGNEENTEAAAEYAAEQGYDDVESLADPDGEEFLKKNLVDVERLDGMLASRPREDDVILFVYLSPDNRGSSPDIRLPGLTHLGQVSLILESQPEDQIPNDASFVKVWTNEALEGRRVSLRLKIPCSDTGVLREVRKITGHPLGEIKSALALGNPLLDLTSLNQIRMIDLASYYEQFRQLIRLFDEKGLEMAFQITAPGVTGGGEVDRDTFQRVLE